MNDKPYTPPDHRPDEGGEPSEAEALAAVHAALLDAQDKWFRKRCIRQARDAALWLHGRAMAEDGPPDWASPRRERFKRAIRSAGLLTGADLSREAFDGTFIVLELVYEKSAPTVPPYTFRVRVGKMAQMLHRAAEDRLDVPDLEEAPA